MRQRGGRQAGIEPAAAAELEPAAGLLVFLIGAAPLALVGFVAEAGVVEAETVVAGALGCPGGGRAAAAGRRVGGLVAAGRLAASGRGGPAVLGAPEGGMLPLVMSTIPKRKYKRSDIEANYRNETKTF